MGRAITIDDDLDDVLDKITTKQWSAKPVAAGEPSPWLAARPKALGAMRNAIGASVYRAYEGANTGGLSGAYWITTTAKNADGTIVIRNMHDEGKILVRSIEAALESEFVFPLLRGRNVQRWSASPIAQLLMVQNVSSRRGIDEEELKQGFPLTYAYLLKFEEQLVRNEQLLRNFCKEVGKGANKRLVPFAPFYSLYNIGEYTLAPFKVCWREQAEFFTSAVAVSGTVAGESKVIIPDHKLMFVPLHSADEAHYVCAMLNSSPAVLIVKSYGVETQTSTHVLSHVRVPQFDRKQKSHQRLSKLSGSAHDLARGENEAVRKQLTKIEAEIDEIAAEVWSITDAELRDIQYSLSDVR